uniref:ATP-dependent DNA helicase n=1 Tax=Octopus bimaculoides TaxID=37653 RepID=A0A0L8GQD9_OCTBM
MLLRNLTPMRGLLNGTRILVLSIKDLFIHGKILNRSKKGEEAFIPCINFHPSERTLPFSMSRQQFPVIPVFAMIINKSQDQSFNNVGIILPSPAFSHGQLYVVLGRSRSCNNIKILVKDHPKQGELIADQVFTRNMALKQLLR